MNVNKKNLILLLVSSLGISNLANINNQQHNNHNKLLYNKKSETKVSLTSMFLNNKLEKDIHIGTSTTVTAITTTEIKKLLTKN